jgi:Arc/MetJ-type ribon-helix-helix transcriptional regulator
MANQPKESTVSTSFTLPRKLFEAVRRHAKSGMTNQSDIVRRALMNYLSPEEREAVLREINSEKPTAAVVATGKRVRYIIRRPRKSSSV